MSKLIKKKCSLMLVFNVSTFLFGLLYSLQEVKANPNNYDAWFDYLRLVESEGNLDVIRETYERAIANVPPTKVSDFLLLPVVCKYVAESVLRRQSLFFCIHFNSWAPNDDYSHCTI
jgi:hypothetical protein